MQQEDLTGKKHKGPWQHEAHDLKPRAFLIKKKIPGRFFLNLPRDVTFRKMKVKMKNMNTPIIVYIINN